MISSDNSSISCKENNTKELVREEKKERKRRKKKKEQKLGIFSSISSLSFLLFLPRAILRKLLRSCQPQQVLQYQYRDPLVFSLDPLL
jgi:hypothetical protein